MCFVRIGRKLINKGPFEDEQRTDWHAAINSADLTLAGEAQKAWEEAHPEDFARVFEEFFEGVWWDMVQEKIGNTFTVGGIIFYSDATNILSHMSAYPIYSKYIKCFQMF